MKRAQYPKIICLFPVFFLYHKKSRSAPHHTKYFRLFRLFHPLHSRNFLHNKKTGTRMKRIPVFAKPNQAALRESTARMMKSVPSISTMAMGNAISQFCTKPVIR